MLLAVLACDYARCKEQNVRKHPLMWTGPIELILQQNQDKMVDTGHPLIVMLLQPETAATTNTHDFRILVVPGVPARSFV